MEVEFEVEVRVREPGGYRDRLSWSSREGKIDAPNLRTAIVEALRQTTGDAAMDLQVIPERKETA